METDVLIVGAGPAGSVCAAFCAEAGLRTVLVERARFPREKVCGDCLNPRLWPILDRLGLRERVLALPHARLESVVFADADEQAAPIEIPFPAHREPEIAVKRSALDSLLLERAREAGAEVIAESPIDSVVREEPGAGFPQSAEPRSATPHWRISSGARSWTSTHLVAADGRNSTVTRLIGLAPPMRKDRVGLQAHIPLPPETRGRVVMRFLPNGYCGLADIGEGEANLCLVARPREIAAIQAWACSYFGLPVGQEWRSITPLRRDPVPPLHPGLLLVGDAARVVEPFTGEGIYYACASGELAARSLLAKDTASLAHRHAALYRGRLWINILAREACLHPRLANTILRTGRRFPALLEWLTHRVVA